MLLATHPVDSLVHQTQDLELVEHDLGPGVGHPGPHGRDVGVVHVQADGLDPLQFLLVEGEEILLQALPATAIGHVFHIPGLQVTDQGHVLMTFGEGLLVDAEMGRHLPRLAALAPADGAVHDAPTAIPAEPRQTAYGLEAALLRQVDDVGLQGPGQIGAGLGPRRGDGEHAVDLALNPGQAGRDVGGHIARVQMAPFSFGGVLVDGTPGVAPRAAQLDPAFMIHVDVDPLLFLKPHLDHDPGTLDSQQTGIELLEVFHDGTPDEGGTGTAIPMIPLHLGGAHSQPG